MYYVIHQSRKSSTSAKVPIFGTCQARVMQFLRTSFPKDGLYRRQRRKTADICRITTHRIHVWYIY